MIQKRNFVRDVLLGLSIGDALGVPVEFKSRAYLKENPVKTMQEYGTHHQPLGTWSDDSSLAFCLAESLCVGYDLQDIANRFLNWYNFSYWTPHGKVFDIGISTSKALHRLENGINPLFSGGNDESDNGNGSLMRILPLIFYLKDKSIEERFGIVGEVSAITHGHIRSVLSCFICCEFALELLKGTEKLKAYHLTIDRINNLAILRQNYEVEVNRFYRILGLPNQEERFFIYDFPENEMKSSGYVLHTLEASMWCFLKTDSYQDAVIKAVNLGEDTDTTGCVTGGLAGLYYGWEAIPKEWLAVLVKKNDIEDLADRLNMKYL